MKRILHQALRPIRFPNLYEYYEKQLAAFWTSDRIDFSTDVEDFKKLTSDQQDYIKDGIAFFYVIDVYISEMLEFNVSEFFLMPELKAFYKAQSLIETVHNEFYSIMAEKILGVEFINNESVQLEYFEKPGIKEKVKWFEKWLKQPESLDVAMGALLIAEFLFVNGNFIPFGLLKLLNKCPGICNGNDGVSIDEYIHARNGFEMLNTRDEWETLYGNYIDYDLLKKRGMTLFYKNNQVSFKDVFLEMLKEAVDVLCACQRELLKKPQCHGLDATNAQLHIKYVANFYCLKLKFMENKFVYPEVLRSPLRFMDDWYAKNETRFCLHEKRSVNYTFTRKVGEGPPIHTMFKVAEPRLRSSLNLSSFSSSSSSSDDDEKGFGFSSSLNSSNSEMGITDLKNAILTFAMNEDDDE